MRHKQKRRKEGKKTGQKRRQERERKGEREEMERERRQKTEKEVYLNLFLKSRVKYFSDHKIK